MARDPYTRNLFASESNLRILRISRDDVLHKTDCLNLFLEQVAKHEIMYPGIVQWLRSKVLPGIKEERRVAYIGLNNNNPVVSAVLKRGTQSKICHLHIDEDIQNHHLGDLFFSMMALDAKRRAEEVHFTLPESLWIKKSEFFRSFGFGYVCRANQQYRSNEDELRCSAPFAQVWQKVLEKLPIVISSLTRTQDGIFSGILMSIKPQYVEKIQSGEKLVEIRRKFKKKWKGCRVTIYSSSPSQALHGYATIENVTEGTPEKIWSQFGEYIGSTKEDFENYARSAGKVYAISLKNYEPYLNPVSTSQLEGLLDQRNLKPPQSYFSLETNAEWAKAVSVAELLHHRFWFYRVGQLDNQ